MVEKVLKKCGKGGSENMLSFFWKHLLGNQVNNLCEKYGVKMCRTFGNQIGQKVRLQKLVEKLGE